DAMAKARSAFVCNDCGAEHAKWQGQCAACQAWNTLSRVSLGAVPAASGGAPGRLRQAGYSGQLSRVQTLGQIDLAAQPRCSASIGELDRVLGGGLVPGSVCLIGGNPGAGKSTLLLQVMCLLAG